MAKIALLIGVSEYEAGLPPLPGTQEDIRAMQRVLTDSYMGDFDNVQLLSNPNPTEMQLAIETLFLEDRRQDDLILLYISGHGIRDDNGYLYLATRTTQLRKTPGQIFTATAVPASSIQTWMSGSRSRRQVLILDCCFSGAFAESMGAKSVEQPIDMRKQLGGEGRAVLTSSTATQVSYANEDTSIYTRYLVEGIETGAADLSNDGIITVDELHQYAKRRTQEAAPAMKPEIFAVREGYTIQLAKAPQMEPKLRYRKEFEECVVKGNGEISPVGRRVLNVLREGLKLSPDEVTAIESEVLEPFRIYQRNLQEYKQTFAEEIEREKILSSQTREELKRLQQLLKLRNEDIAPIEEAILSIRRPPTIERIEEEPQQSSEQPQPPRPISNSRPWKYVLPVAIISIGIIAIGIRFVLSGTPTQFSDVKDVPKGTFQYTGSTTWSSLRCADGMTGIDTQIHFSSGQRNFKPIYAVPGDINPNFKNSPPNSLIAIELLTKYKEVAFAISSRPLEDEEKQRARDKGFNLVEFSVARDVTAIAVNPSLDIAKIGGLTLHELENIYTSNTSSWKQVRGDDLKIAPYIHQAETKKQYPFQKEVLKRQPFGSTVTPVPNSGTGIKNVSANLGGIYLAPAALVYRESGVQPMPIVGDDNKPILPFEKSFNPKKICENANSEDSSPLPLNSQYPKELQQEVVYVIVKDYEGDTNPQEMAGRAYANLLKTDQGQRIMEQMGFQRY